MKCIQTVIAINFI